MTHHDLRQLLLSAAPTPPPADPVGVLRRRLRRRRLAAAGAAAGAGAAGVAIAAAVLAAPGSAPQPDSLVASSPEAEAAPVAVVPFVRRPYPPFGTGSRPAPTEPDCASRSLSAQAATDDSQPMTGGSPALTVRITNTGSSACQVLLRGKVSVRDADGAVIVSGFLGSGIGTAGGLPPAVPPGGAAVLTGAWSDGCGLPGTGRLSVVVELQRDTPEGSTAVIVDELPEDAPTPACPPDDGVTYVNGPVGLYDLVVLDDRRRRADDPTMSLQAELVDVPDQVRQGQALAFGVRLRNPTDGPIELTYENCPLYAATLNRNNGAATPVIDGAINCQDAPSEVPAGGSVVFLMQFDIPSDRYAAGAWDLSWTRTDAGTAPLQAEIAVTAA